MAFIVDSSIDANQIEQFIRRQDKVILAEVFDEFESDKLIPGLTPEQKKALEKAISDSVNKWIKKSQEVAAEKMQWVMWKMWMWDMLGWLPGIK